MLLSSRVLLACVATLAALGQAQARQAPAVAPGAPFPASAGELRDARRLMTLTSQDRLRLRALTQQNEGTQQHQALELLKRQQLQTPQGLQFGPQFGPFVGKPGANTSMFTLKDERWIRQTNPEGVLKDRLNLMIADLTPTILKVTATPDECSVAERAMRNGLTAGNNDFVDMWMHEFASSADSVVSNPALINADSYQLVRQYKQKCLAPTSAFVASAALRTTTAQAMGVLFHKAGGWGVVCSVTRVAPGLVLTARHCFYERGSTTVSAGLAEAVAANKYKVLLPDMAIEMLVTGVRCADAADLASPRCQPYSLFPSTQAGFASDFIVLEVAEPAGLAAPNVVLNSAGVERGMAIMLVSWNLFGAIDATYQHFEQALSPAAAEADFRQTAQLSMSRGGTCAIATVRNACITHTCQSTPGSSGAALFAPQADGSIRILAVHVADMNASASYMQADSCDFGGLRAPVNFYHTPQVVNFGNAGRLLNR